MTKCHFFQTGATIIKFRTEISANEICDILNIQHFFTSNPPSVYLCPPPSLKPSLLTMSYLARPLSVRIPHLARSVTSDVSPPPPPPSPPPPSPPPPPPPPPPPLQIPQRTHPQTHQSPGQTIRSSTEIRDARRAGRECGGEAGDGAQRDHGVEWERVEGVESDDGGDQAGGEYE